MEYNRNEQRLEQYKWTMPPLPAYDPGQDVWLMVNNGVYQGWVVSITTNSTYSHDRAVHKTIYCIKVVGIDNTMDYGAESLFPTKRALLDSL